MFSLVLLAIFASKKPTKNGRDRFFMEKLRFSNGFKIHIFVYRRLGKVGMNQKLIFFEVMYKKSFIIFAFSDSWKIWPMPPCISGDSNFANPCYVQSLYFFLYQDKTIFYLCRKSHKITREVYRRRPKVKYKSKSYIEVTQVSRK